MSCESKFSSDVSLSCILGLVADIRKGITPATIAQALWVAGCLITKLSPSEAADGTPEAGIASEASLEDLLNTVELECEGLQREASVAAMASPVADTQGWEVLIPLFLELVKIIIENRKKKQQPSA
jgi:hypothetical protein